MIAREGSIRRVLIVGGGIAGMTTAIALARRGHQVELAELNPDWQVTGWGLSLTGPSLRALHGLGLADACLERGYGISQISNCDSAGEVVNVIGLPRLVEERPAQAGLSRTVLHRILREAAADSGAVLHTALSVEKLEQDADGVDALLTDGTRRRVDLVVGADGVRSVVRELIGLSAEPQYTDQMVWRAMVPRPEWATTLLTFAGQVHNAGLIPISPEQAYVFVTENGADSAALPQPELAARMTELMAGFTGRVAQVRESITDPDSVVRRPVRPGMIDGPWHRGRVLIVGDAAHAPSPQLVSGAALAIEDGTVLAEELDRHGDVEEALAAFGARRLERCRLVVDSSARIARLERDGEHAEAHRLQQNCHQSLAQPA